MRTPGLPIRKVRSNSRPAAGRMLRHSEHAKILREKHGYSVDGIDLEPNLVAIAQKNPGNFFSVADMRRFSLPSRYDAITCLFSSIGYTETKGA